MLRRFLYLDTTALAQYVSALEGGQLTESTSRSLRRGTGGGELDAKVVKLNGEKGHEDERSLTLADTDEARFDRLLKAAAANSDEVGWIDTLQPDTDFQEIGLGAMVSWECDLYVPSFVQMLAKSGEAVGALNMMQTLLPAARDMGLTTTGLPGADAMKAAASFIGGVGAKLLIVGEDDDTDWKVAAHVDDAFQHGDLEGRARVVGKVSRVLKAGQWLPFLTFPGMKLVAREERRRLERQAPAPGKEGEYLSGPAIMLDLLAVYR